MERHSKCLAYIKEHMWIVLENMQMWNLCDVIASLTRSEIMMCLSILKRDNICHIDVLEKV